MSKKKCSTEYEVRPHKTNKKSKDIRVFHKQVSANAIEIMKNDKVKVIIYNFVVNE